MPDKELRAKCGRGRDDSDHDYDHSFVPAPSTVDEARRGVTVALPAFLRGYEHQCIREVGRPGAFHGCNKGAQWAFRGKYGWLWYCKRHAPEGSVRQ